TFFYFVGGLVVDPHLALMAESLRGLDTRVPIVHLDPYYYLPMRYYYLPERVHRMAGPDYKVLNWEALPGYRAYLTPEELRRVKVCAVIDPRHLLSEKVLAVASGAAVAREAYPRKTGGP